MPRHDVKSYKDDIVKSDHEQASNQLVCKGRYADIERKIVKNSELDGTPCVLACSISSSIHEAHSEDAQELWAMGNYFMTVKHKGAAEDHLENISADE